MKERQTINGHTHTHSAYQGPSSNLSRWARTLQGHDLGDSLRWFDIPRHCFYHFLHVKPALISLCYADLLPVLRDNFWQSHDRQGVHRCLHSRIQFRIACVQVSQWIAPHEQWHATPLLHSQLCLLAFHDRRIRQSAKLSINTHIYVHRERGRETWRFVDIYHWTFWGAFFDQIVYMRSQEQVRHLRWAKTVATEQVLESFLLNCRR